MPVASSWGEIINLTDKLKSSIKNISLYNATLAVQLKTAEQSFKDEGIEIIREHISNTKNKISESLLEFEAMIKNLTSYAILLKKAEDATAYQYERTR